MCYYIKKVIIKQVFFKERVLGIILYLILLSFMQGITEFLPVSSSAHLLILPYLTSIKDQGILIDICAHIGSLLAVCFFYRKDIWQMITALFKADTKSEKKDRILDFKLIIAFMPIVIFGIVMFMFNLSEIRNPGIVIYTSAIFGVILYIADVVGSKKYDIYEVSYLSAFLIGVSQVLATVPGVSRSGVTLTTAMFCGQNRASALKFTFLLSIPTILLVAIGGFMKFLVIMPVKLNYCYILITIVASFIFSLLAIKFILKWVRRSSFKIFAIYRILLSLFLYIFLK